MQTISIVIPVYNVAPYLRRCLDSCLSQTYQDIEIIAVDDGSTDGSAEILDEYAIKDGRIRVVHQENQGAMAARANGVEHSNGQWVCFVDADDAIPNNSLELLYEYANKYKVDVSIGGYTRKYEDKENYCGFEENEISGEEFLFLLLSGNWKLSGPVAKLFKRTLFIEGVPQVGKNIRVGEDLLLNVHLATVVKKAVLIPHSVYSYYQIGTSATHTFRYTIDYALLYLNILKEILENRNVTNTTELLRHYQINLMYNVLLDDIDDKIDYSSKDIKEIKRESYKIHLNKKEKLILFLLEFSIPRICYRKLLSNYRKGTGVLYKMISVNHKTK